MLRLKPQHNKDCRKGSPTKDKRTKEKSKKGKGKRKDYPWAWTKMPFSEGEHNEKKKCRREYN